MTRIIEIIMEQICIAYPEIDVLIYTDLVARKELEKMLEDKIEITRKVNGGRFPGYTQERINAIAKEFLDRREQIVEVEMGDKKVLSRWDLLP